MRTAESGSGQIRGSTLMAGKRVQRSWWGDGKYFYYLLVFGGLQQACVFTFQFYEP